MLRYKIAPKCLLPGPFGHSDVGGNPGVAGRFVAIISFLHTPVSSAGADIADHQGGVPLVGAVVAVEMVHGEGAVGANVHAPGMAGAPVTAVAAVEAVQPLPEHHRGDVAYPAGVQDDAHAGQGRVDPGGEVVTPGPLEPEAKPVGFNAPWADRPCPEGLPAGSGRVLGRRRLMQRRLAGVGPSGPL